ncbi:MAG: hypothetical protein ACLVHV_13810 [Oscillospiraceae bacterium]
MNVPLARRYFDLQQHSRRAQRTIELHATCLAECPWKKTLKTSSLFSREDVCHPDEKVLPAAIDLVNAQCPDVIFSSEIGCC